MVFYFLDGKAADVIMDSDSFCPEVLGEVNLGALANQKLVDDDVLIVGPRGGVVRAA